MYEFNNLSSAITLSNGVGLPCVGYGTWRSPDSELTSECVTAALKAGYRHIDGAAVYRNETRVGQGIRDSGVAREKIFVTSKLWNTCRSYDKALRAFDDTLSDLGLDYLDLYLIHWPAGKNVYTDWAQQNSEAWRALEKLYRDGRVKAIGVSNFTPFYLKELFKTAQIKPMVNQIRYYAFVAAIVRRRANARDRYDYVVVVRRGGGDGKERNGDGKGSRQYRRYGGVQGQLCAVRRYGDETHAKDYAYR